MTEIDSTSFHLRMIGIWQEFSETEDPNVNFLEIHRKFFSQLVEMDYPERYGRIARFGAYRDGMLISLFLGLVVQTVNRIPEGMFWWELSEKTLTIRRPEKDGMGIGLNESVEWIWKATPEPEKPEIFGDFSCRDTKVRYYLTAFAWHDFAGIIASADDVYLVPFDPSWSHKYIRCVNSIREIRGGDLFLRIVHFGSTAIPGMPAKPVIDILAEVQSLQEFRMVFLPEIFNLPWEFWWFEDHITIILRETVEGPRYAHLHIASPGHRIWNGLIFRDYLSSHPEVATEYAALKRDLSVRYRNDREMYTRAKGEFVRNVLRMAEESGFETQSDKPLSGSSSCGNGQTKVSEKNADMGI